MPQPYASLVPGTDLSGIPFNGAQRLVPPTAPWQQPAAATPDPTTAPAPYVPAAWSGDPSTPAQPEGLIPQYLRSLRDQIVAEGARNGARQFMTDMDTQAIDRAGSLVPPVASAARYGASYFPTSIRDAVTSKQIDQYAGAGTGSQAGDLGPDAYGVANQGAAGFNKGFGNVAFLPFDAVDQVRNYLTGRQGTSLHSLFDKMTVDPAGEPQTIMQHLVRAGGQGVGSAVLPMTAGMGVAQSGLRSGVTLADRAVQPGLDAIQPSAGGILGRLKDLANGFNPRNIASAFQPTNLQASADGILNAVAANPLKSAAAKSYHAFTKGERNARQQMTAPQYATADQAPRQ
jgi:hypothetical protein